MSLHGRVASWQYLRLLRENATMTNASSRPPGRWGRRLRRGLLFTAILFGAIQFVPYGREHGNPPTRVEPTWDSPRTRELAQRACFDCHSNETVWPWYSSVAPVSWLVQRDVDHGRKQLNFSEWDRPQEEADEAAEAVENGEMPLASYLWTHPDAKLTEQERSELIAGLAATTGRHRERR